MTKICYVDKKFGPDALAIIDQANRIIAEYEKKKLGLTLRSLYYQFVARGIFKENTAAMYAKLGSVLNDGRLAGLVSWTAIEDSLRQLEGVGHVTGPAEAIKRARDRFKLDLWADQEWQPEVWIEKDAMVNVIRGICIELRVNWFACRGYASQSSMWRAGQRLAGYVRRGKRPIIFHFGDHDPSGIDMTRDNHERLEMFVGVPITFVRLGLNYDQVERYNPPPNYAKATDSRHGGYVERFGEQCWELDALDPQVISDLIAANVARIRDDKKWDAALAREAEDMDRLDRLIEDFGGSAGIDPWSDDEDE